MTGRWVVLVVGATLLAAGTLVLIYEGFTYTTETHDAQLGPLELEFRERDRVEIPSWVGVALIIAGGVVLAAGVFRGRPK